MVAADNGLQVWKFSRVTRSYRVLVNEFSASASVAGRVVSFVSAFVFPIFAPVLYGKMGYWWTDSALAFAIVTYMLPVCCGRGYRADG